MNRTATASITALAALVALAPAASAAPGGIRVAKFDVTIKGVQTNVWSQNHAKTSRCDHDLTGSGRETVRFASRRPVRMRVFTYRGSKLLILAPERSRGGFGDADLPVAGRVTRSGSQAISNFDPRCGGTGGGGTVRSDCGSRRFGGDGVRLSFLDRRRLRLQQGDLRGLTAFRSCPLLGTGFPSVIDSDSRYRPITADFPAREVFDRSFGKFIVVGRGTQKRRSAESSDTTSIRWEATFRRVDARRGR